MKIAVIGYTGSGKSVLAAKLGKIIGCPVLHLDKLQFEAGWKERGEAEGKMLCEQFLEENKDRGWVIDGNYEKFCLKNGRSQEKKEGYKQVSEHYPDKFIQVRNRRQLRAAVIRLLQLQNEKGLYAGTGSRKR